MPTGNPNNPLYQFSISGQGAGSGFGEGAWNRAIAAGLAPAQIKQELMASGLTVGPWVQQRLASIPDAPVNTATSSTKPPSVNNSQGQYQQQFNSAQQDFFSATNQYQNQLRALTDDFTNRSKGYQDSLTAYQKQIADSQAKLNEGRLQADSLTRDRDKWKSDYEQLKSLNDRQKAMQEDLDLARLRSGSTITGSNATQGSLQAGNAVSRGNANGGRLLVDRQKEADNSVLQHKVSDIVAPVSGGSYASGGSGGGGSTASIASGNKGGTLASYYASRFGK